MRGASRVTGESGFVLHSYPYSETSLLIEAFTREHGRVPLIAKGAKRPRSSWRGVLLAFQPLSLSWSGSGDVKTLSAADWQPGLPLLEGGALACGFYMNELLLKLIAREDPIQACSTAIGWRWKASRAAPIRRRACVVSSCDCCASSAMDSR